MAGLVMMGLISLMVVTLLVMAVMRKGWKRIFQTFAGFLAAIGLLHLYVVKTCGPNSKDVELMKPQAEAITKYILENGPPKSMMEIPNLPYKLGRCEVLGKNYETCHFNTNTKLHKVNFEYFADTYIYIKILNKKSETGISMFLDKHSDDSWCISRDIKPFSTKNDGICDPLKQ